MVPQYQLQTFSGGNKGSLFGSSVIVNLLCAAFVSDKHNILIWCTDSVTLFHFAQPATVPFHATETLSVVEPLQLISRDILKRG